MSKPPKGYLTKLARKIKEAGCHLPADVVHEWASSYVSCEYWKDDPNTVAELANESYASSGDKRTDVIDEFLRDTDDNYRKATEGDCSHWTYHIDLEAYWQCALRYDWNEIEGDDGKLYYFWNR